MTSNTDTALLVRDARNRYRTKQRQDNGAHGAFDGELKRNGETPRSEPTVYRAAAPADIAELLGTTDEVVVRDRKMFAGNRLVQLAISYIPTDVAVAAGLEQADTGIGGMISRMRDAGFDQGDTADEDVELVPADAKTATSLNVEEGRDLITITHIGRTAEGRVVEVTRHTLAPGWKIKYTTPIN